MSCLEKSTRIFNCGLCHLQILVCTDCDRGQRYCKPCAKVARQRSVRIAKRRYQKTRQGRLKHAARQRRYKLKKQLLQIMTYTGSPEQPPHDSLPLGVKLTTLKSPTQRACHFCGCVCGSWLRYDFLTTAVLKTQLFLKSDP